MADLQPPVGLRKVLTEADCKGCHLAAKVLYDRLQRKNHVFTLHLHRKGLCISDTSGQDNTPSSAVVLTPFAAAAPDLGVLTHSLYCCLRA